MTPSRAANCGRKLFVLAAVSIIALTIVSASDPRLIKPRAHDNEEDEYEIDDPEESAPLLSNSVIQETIDVQLHSSDLFPKALTEHRQSQAPSSASSLLPPTGSSSNSSAIDNDSFGSKTETGAVDNRSPASRVTMLKPKLNQANPLLFPIGSRIDLEWAFDQKTLLSPPRSLTLEAALVSDSSRLWPIANLSGSATSTIWDTAKVKEHLPMGLYTL
ncbi:hypothetical protein BGZ68_002409 [Mortierella alpina]|nr:hypothetical protein BGZ68_002409 [Mortierella alpina]